LDAKKEKRGLITMPKGSNAPIGKSAFKRYYKGEKLAFIESIQAHCYDCMGFYEDGKMDCKCPRCSLYPWMPYKEKKS
jgi:hypothetical protein